MNYITLLRNIQTHYIHKKIIYIITALKLCIYIRHKLSKFDIHWYFSFPAVFPFQTLASCLVLFRMSLTCQSSFRCQWLRQQTTCHGVSCSSMLCCVSCSRQKYISCPVREYLSILLHTVTELQYTAQWIHSLEMKKKYVAIFSIHFIPRYFSFIYIYLFNNVPINSILNTINCVYSIIISYVLCIRDCSTDCHVKAAYEA